MRIASRIGGFGIYIPERKITNEDVLQKLVDASKGYLSKEDLDTIVAKSKHKLTKAGNQTRFWCQEDQTSTDIARLAVDKALDDAGIDAKDIDLIIYTGMSKAFVEPATAHVLRHEIGALNANVIDTQDACTSFIKSMEIADSLIKTGRYETVLIAAGERTYDWADFTCKTVDELTWKFGALTIGDAAGAMVLQRTEDPQYVDNPKHMRFFYKLADGEYATCHIGLNHRFGERYRLNSHSSKLVRLGMQMIMELVVEVLQHEEFKEIQYDNLFIHDIGKIIDEMVLPFIREAKVCIPDNYRSYYPRLGNIASVSLPVGMETAREAGVFKGGNLAIYVCPAAGVQGGITSFLY